jgi:hypothetical protein
LLCTYVLSIGGELEPTREDYEAFAVNRAIHDLVVEAADRPKLRIRVEDTRAAPGRFNEPG